MGRKKTGRSVGQPRKYSGEICRVRSFSLPESLLDKLASIAPRHGQSALLARLLADGIEREGLQPRPAAERIPGGGAD
jgi:hypothetical protein